MAPQRTVDSLARGSKQGDRQSGAEHSRTGCKGAKTKTTLVNIKKKRENWGPGSPKEPPLFLLLDIYKGCLSFCSFSSFSGVPCPLIVCPLIGSSQFEARLSCFGLQRGSLARFARGCCCRDADGTTAGAGNPMEIHTKFVFVLGFP